MDEDMDIEDVPEFAFLGVNVELKSGALDTLRVSNAVDVFDVAGSGERGGQRGSDVGIDSCLKIQRTRALPLVFRRRKGSVDAKGLFIRRLGWQFYKNMRCR